MKFDGNCLHGASPTSSGDCTEPCKENSCLCEYHHQLVVDGVEKAPPLRMNIDYNTSSKAPILVYDLPERPLGEDQDVDMGEIWAKFSELARNINLKESPSKFEEAVVLLRTPFIPNKELIKRTVDERYNKK